MVTAFPHSEQNLSPKVKIFTQSLSSSRTPSHILDSPRNIFGSTAQPQSPQNRWLTSILAPHVSGDLLPWRAVLGHQPVADTDVSAIFDFWPHSGQNFVRAPSCTPQSQNMALSIFYILRYYTTWNQQKPPPPFPISPAFFFLQTLIHVNIHFTHSRYNRYCIYM